MAKFKNTAFKILFAMPYQYSDAKVLKIIWNVQGLALISLKK